MREGTPSGFSTISTGVPSGRYGMSSSGRIRAITPLLPWRPAILSPTDSLRFMATKTLTSLMTPGGSSSPRLSRLSFSANSVFRTSIWRSVLSTMSLSASSMSSPSPALDAQLQDVGVAQLLEHVAA